MTTTTTTPNTATASQDLTTNFTDADSDFDPTRIFIDDLENSLRAERRRERWCGRICASANLTTLWVMFGLTTTFALAQLAASVVANSLSLASDSGTMLVDAFTYSVNMYAEYKKANGHVTTNSKYEVYAALFSVTVLIIVTSVMLSQGAHRMCCVTTLDSSVNGGIVIGFSSTNLAIDIIMCGKFWGQSKHRWRPSSPLPHLMDTTKDEPNMASAFVHLFADSLRTLTSMIAGGLEIDASTRDTLYIDGLSTIIVGIVILLAALFVLYEAIQSWKNLNLQGSTNTQEGLGDTMGSPTTSLELVRHAERQ